jgi:Aldehyde dehydrogenase family
MIETKVGSFTPESRLLIDGELVDAESGRRFDNINPATEEVLGQVADAGHEDMGRAITAARRAFDETDWATNRALRRRCLEQLQEAIEAEREEMRAGTGRRGRHARHGDLLGPAGRAAGGRLPVAGEEPRAVPVGAAAG